MAASRCKRASLLALLGMLPLLTRGVSAAEPAQIAANTERWMNAVVNKSSPEKVAALFCSDGVLVATAGVGLRKQTCSTDGWGQPKKEGTTIESYVDWFAKLPEQNITAHSHNIVQVEPGVWINNAWVNWTWVGNPGLTARMTFIFRETPEGSCIFELHSSALPSSPEERRLRGSLSSMVAPGRPALPSSFAELAASAGTETWMDAVVNRSDPQAVAQLFCEDAVLVATAGVGLRKQTLSTDGWGKPKEQGTTIGSYFDWFAKLPQQKIVRSHFNIVEVAPNVLVNNAWVDWKWEGNPGLTARMAFVYRVSPEGTCLFELHSSQLPEN